uniref:Uncharacterized protein n=1 Tax=Fagus sylvatica TaxID=28930 RepID=A0A2N9EPN1_FAGSY
MDLDDRPFVPLMFRVEAFDDVPCNVVFLSTTIVYVRHSRGVVTVVRLLGDEPIRCPLFRRGSFLGDGRDTLISLDPLHFSLKRFFVGVCREAESGGRVLDLGDLVSPDNVLRGLSEELFDFVFPALDTWKVVREDSHSTEDTPSVSGSSRAVGPDDSWIARSYLSKVVDVEGLDKLRSRYQIPEDVVLRIPESDEVACSSRFGDVAFYEADFNAGVRFPMQPLMRELLDRLNLAPGQLAPNAWRTVVGSMVMWKVLSEGKDDLTLDELLFCYKPCQIPASPGFWSLNMRQRGLKLIVGTPSSNREWKDNYVFVCGDNWEGLQCEKDDNFIPVRREWGVPSSSALRRPKLDEDGHNRVLRALHHTQHHYKHFIRPELLALYSFGPEPSEAVLSLQEINQKRMATAKLNREKLKKMMMTQQEEAPLVIGKKRKADTSSKKATEERTLPPPPSVQKPSIPEPVPTSSVEVVDITAEPSSSRPVEKVPTLPRDASLACRRAKSVVTKDDVDEYEKVNTDVVKGLTELTVIANRCIQWEEALLKQKIKMSEAAQSNQRLTALVNELTLDRDRVVGEMSTLKVDMAKKDEDLKKALDGARKSEEQVKTLTSQLERARVSAVEEFKSSEAYDDVNTKYFLSGFNFLKKQAKEKFPQLDCDAFQPFDDDESTMPADEGNVEAPTNDPQMDNDATS